MTDRPHVDPLTAAADQARRERVDQAEGAHLPGRDDELEALAADFVGRVRMTAPLQFVGLETRCWIVWTTGTLDGARVVALGGDAVWRLGETKWGADSRVVPVTTLTDHDRGRPNANVGLREGIAQHLGWLRAGALRMDGASSETVAAASIADASILKQLPEWATRELGRLLADDEDRASRMASRPAGETASLPEAVEELIAGLLLDLAERGHPGAIPDPSKTPGLLRRRPTPDRYPLDNRKGVERVVRAEFNATLVEVSMTFNGDVRHHPDEQLAVPLSRQDLAAMLCRFASSKGIRRRVPAVLQNAPGWPSGLRWES